MTRPIGLAIRLEPDEMPPHLAELSALGHPELPYRTREQRCRHTGSTAHIGGSVRVPSDLDSY